VLWCGRNEEADTNVRAPCLDVVYNLACVGAKLLHNRAVLNLVRIGVLMAILLGITGCSTPSKPLPKVTPVTQLASPPVTSAPLAKPEVLEAPAPAPAPVPAPAPPPAVANRAPETWIAFERWCQMQGMRLAAKPLVGGQTGFQAQNAQSNLLLVPGNRIAYWNGLGFWLGFSPRWVRGQLVIHNLDLEKNVQPLLAGRSFALKTNAVIVLDPGHGGKDPGAQNVFNHRWEKEFTLDWALRLRKLLSTNGWTVRLTRTNDVDLALSNRVAFAERCQADLFISLHFNSAPMAEPSGLETYCLTPVGLPSSINRNYEDHPEQNYPNNMFDEQNLCLALQIQRALVDATHTSDRTVRRARFIRVLRGQNRPGVLVEGGFLSNPREARRIAEPAYRQLLSEAVARALMTGAAVQSASVSSEGGQQRGHSYPLGSHPTTLLTRRLARHPELHEFTGASYD